MLIIKTPQNLHQMIQKLQQEKKRKRIALIPTMGNLHDGHIALIEAGKIRADIVVVSIFINPLQFDKPQDLENYPHTLESDCDKLTSHGVDIVFTPTTSVMYPDGINNQTFVEVPNFSTMLEGKSRPGHFRGVTTIVSKLFNLTKPDVACFGEKDFQQLALIRKLVLDMNYSINIIGVPTVRTNDGLALSSRNSYLTPKERQLAPKLYQVLQWSVDQLYTGESSIFLILDTASEKLRRYSMKPDILDIRDVDTLLPLTINSKRAVILFSAWLGKARLIDNIQVDLSVNNLTKLLNHN